MDAHDELFYRLNHPDPKMSAWAELQLIGQILGSNFVEQWLEWNGFEDELREWTRSASSVAMAAERKRLLVRLSRQQGGSDARRDPSQEPAK